MYLLKVFIHRLDTEKNTRCAAGRWIIEAVGTDRLASQETNELSFLFDDTVKMKNAVEKIHKLSINNIITVPLKICEDGSWETLCI